jgi:MoaA/NifB/PqqE/SkfB family radical SAM enzyme
MCDIWKRKDAQELSVSALERHRASLRALGVRQVVLSGGEPLLNRQLPAICAFFQDLGIRVTLLTTGLLLHQRASLLASTIDEIILSLDGPAEVHNAIRGIPRAFQVISRGVASIRSRNPAVPITCRTTVQKQNHTSLQATVEAAHTLELDGISFLPADLTSSAFNREEQPWSPGRQNQVALNASEILALEHEIESLIRTFQPDIQSRFIAEGETKLRRLPQRFREHLEGTPPRAPLCNAPWVSAVMELDASVRPCFFHAPTGSTATGSLEAAVNSPQALAFRRQLDVTSNPTCQRCVCSLNYR